MSIRDRISVGVRRTAAILGAGALMTLGAAATPATASTGPDYHPLISNSSWLNVGVRGVRPAAARTSSSGGRTERRTSSGGVSSMPGMRQTWFAFRIRAADCA